jgi:hypothetical protein
MGYTAVLLDDVRSQIAPDDVALKVARERRDAVTGVADGFHGALRTFASGSLAHRTANCPVHHRDAGLDADGGVVLDRRSYPLLGPDSPFGLGPNEVVDAMAQHLRSKLTPKYPNLKVKVTKRAVLLSFGAPLPGGEDPTVDIVVALDRANAPGLWIPNTEQNGWDPSHPEEHTRLLTADPADVRLVRQHAIRLAKAENKRDGNPPLCSFNLEAFGLMFVGPRMTDAEALLAMWRDGATDLSWRLTPDPAGVSAPIRVEDQRTAVERLAYAARELDNALRNDNNEHYVRARLANLFPEFVSAVPGGTSTARIAAASRVGDGLKFGATGIGLTGAAVVNSTVRSYGDGPSRW